MGHRDRFGRDFGTGGAENGTPGEVRQGFRDRWGGKRDTGRGLEKFSGKTDSGKSGAAGGNENGQTLGPVRNKYIKVFGQ